MPWKITIKMTPGDRLLELTGEWSRAAAPLAPTFHRPLTVL